MIIVNADQEQGGMSTDAGGRRRALSGPVGQFIVFFNGLILTVAAFGLVSIMFSELLREEKQRNALAAEKMVQRNLSELESSVRSAAMVISLSRDRSESMLARLIDYTIADIKKFDHLVWLEKTPDGDWHYRELFSSNGKVIGMYEANQQSFSDRLVEYISGAGISGSDVRVLTDIPGVRYMQVSSDPHVLSRPFALVRQIRRQNGAEDFIVAFSRFDKLFDLGWADRKNAVEHLSVVDPVSQRKMMELSWHEGAELVESVAHRNALVGTQIKVGGVSFSMSIVPSVTNHNSVLQYSPFIVLLFGIALTVVGTMFVRNNQRQAYKLASMNKALAQKNMEMNVDAAERERLNNALRKSEREHKAIINAVSDIIFEVDTNGNIQFLNQTWSEITGFDVARSMGCSIFDLLHPQEQEEQRRQFNLLVKGHIPAYRSITRLQNADSSYRSVELAISMLRQDENKQIRAVGTITDVEERRRAEKALREAEQKYRTIVENIAGGIYQMTPDGRYISANPAMARIFGYESADDLMSPDVNAISHIYINAADHGAMVRSLESSGQIKNFEIQARRRDGTVIWINENVRAVRDEDQRILYYEGSVEDITQRKNAEIQLRNAKLESDLSSRAKSEFLANMSHELRTPLNAIIGFSEIIKDEVFGPVEQRQYWEYANDIFNSGRHLLKIINEILDVARIEAGERQLNEQVVNIEKVLKSALDLLGPKIEGGHLVVINQVEGKAPKLIGEETAIKQMLTNILSNAAKFTPTGGRITVSSEIDGEGYFRLSVTDTGIGLERDEIERALSPFGQVNANLDRTASGAGLGLTLVGALIRLHGGRFELFSQKGIGTTATLIFPPSRVPEQEGESQHSAQKSIS